MAGVPALGNFEQRITEVSEELDGVRRKLDELTNGVIAKRHELFRAPLEGEVEDADWQGKMVAMKADFENLAKIFGQFGRHVAPKIREMDNAMETLRLTVDNMHRPYDAYMAHGGAGEVPGQQKIALAMLASGGHPIVSNRFQGFTDAGR